MYKLLKNTLFFGALFMTGLMLQSTAFAFEGIGRNATQDEVKAWDIDVRPDFKGLPKGSGSVATGMQIWESRCATCHGTFGESNEVFTPIVGGTTKKDQETGRVASLTDPKQAQRTTLMKVATVSSLFDYIYRAMPWNAPRSLSPDDTYAVLAYVLSLAEIVPDDFVLSDRNISDVQSKMPNRNGMTTKHGMWNARGKPDVQGRDCMTNCAAEVKIISFLPDYARNAHNNLAEQNRTFGPFLGVDTTKPPLASLPSKNIMRVSATSNEASSSSSPQDLFKRSNCGACHGLNNKIVGPAVTDIAKKYKGNATIYDALVAKVKNGGSGVWGQIPMPANSDVSDADIKKIVTWILSN